MVSRLLEYSNPDIEKGDTILVGRWRNSPAIVKGFGKDKNNQPVVITSKGRYSLYKFRLQKLMKEGVIILHPIIRKKKTIVIDVEICPHCNKEIGEKETYMDPKNFVFHRSCMDKGPIDQITPMSREEVAKRMGW
jgi:hypothetical protein